jgi:predicted O-methyltransferase YrrM
MTEPAFARSNPELSDAMALMHTLMEYRSREIYGRLRNIGTSYSMLHIDVLALLYHFAKVCSGHVLEIGPYIGGSTIAVALGVQDSGIAKTIVSIEEGGKLEHPTLASRNILKDLRKNLARHGLLEMVTLVEGRSVDPGTVTKVQQAVGPQQVGLFILDAAGAVKGDIACYEDRLAPGCLVVIDDYYTSPPLDKAVGIRADVDSLVANGSLIPLGFYGHGTWSGRWVSSTPA